MKTKEPLRPFWKYSFILLLAFLATTITLNCFLRHNFYNQSLNFIISLQRHANHPLNIFMNTVSLLANTHFILTLLIVLYVVFKRKLAVMVYVSYFLLNTYLANVLKMSYQEPRPFWAAHGVKKLEWGCPYKYGNPSGHSWMVVVIYEPLVTDFILSGIQRSYHKRIWYILPLLAGVLVPFSRVYLGSHTGNEIMMGLTIGVIMTALYRWKIQELIYDFYLSLYNPISNSTRAQLAITNLFIVTVPMLIFCINSVNPSLVHYPYIHNLSSKCKTDQYTAHYIEASSLKAHTIINLAFGFIFALASSKTSYMYYLGKWEYTSLARRGVVWTFLKKLLLEGGMPFVPVLIGTILMPFMTKNPYIRYLSSCIGYWLCGFILVRYGDRILRRCNVTKLVGEETVSAIIRQPHLQEIDDIPL